MADQLYLSLWTKGFSAMSMLAQFEKLLKLFPFSSLSQRESVLRIYGVAYTEPVVLEMAVPPPVDIEQIVAAAKDFQHVDSCYELNTWWDLWTWENDWKLAPVRLAITCFGPDFEHESDENFRFDFGVEDQFLPGPQGAAGMKMVRANVQSLLRLVHDVDDRMGLDRRRLSTESGTNFAETLQGALEDIEE